MGVVDFDWSRFKWRLHDADQCVKRYCSLKNTNKKQYVGFSLLKKN